MFPNPPPTQTQQHRSRRCARLLHRAKVERTGILPISMIVTTKIDRAAANAKAGTLPHVLLPSFDASLVGMPGNLGVFVGSDEQRTLALSAVRRPQ